MKKIVILSMLVLASFYGTAQKKTLYDFKVENIDGSEFDMSSLKGKKVLIVNVASLCGLTPQYKDLENLYQKYKDENFIIIAFPSNDFKEQEPGTNEEIALFCSSEYQITFPIMAKVSVSGHDICPLYKWLTTQSENGKINAPVQWNFQKFLINEQGRLEKMVTPQTNPLDKEIVNWIKK